MLHYVGDAVTGKQARIELGATTIYPRESAKGQFRINDKTVIKRYLSGESPNISDALAMGIWYCQNRPQNSGVMGYYTQPIKTIINTGYIG
jgi:hypothetical protein